MKLFIKKLSPVLIIFLTLLVGTFLLKPVFLKYNVDQHVLYGANFLFLCVSMVVFFMQKKALTNANPNVFIRSVIAGMMIKMFATVIAVLAYVVLTGKDYNTKAVFIALIMYLFYLAAEVWAITKENSRSHA